MNFTAKIAGGYTGYLGYVYQLLSLYVTAPDRQCNYNVILGRVRATVRVFEKEYVLHVVAVCLKL